MYGLTSPLQAEKVLLLIKEFIQLKKEFNRNSAVLTYFRSFIEAAENYEVQSYT